MTESLIQNGEAYGGLGTRRCDNLTWLRSILQNSSRKTAAFVVQSLGWFFLSLGEWHVGKRRSCSVTFCQVVFARHPKTPLRHVGVHHFRHVVFVSMPVGRINCLLDLSSTWLSFLWLFRSVFGSCPSCSAHLTQRRFDVQVGMMSRRLPHSVSQNHGHRVVKYCNTLNDLMVWCLFCWRASWTENRRCGRYPQMCTLIWRSPQS